MTPSMNAALTWWMQKYQPELLNLTCLEYRTLIDSLNKDAYVAAKELEAKGWDANFDLVCALADVQFVSVTKDWPEFKKEEK